MKKQILTVSLCLGLAAMAGCSCSSPADATTASFPETSPAVTETPAATTALPTESVPETTLPETTSSPETTAALKNVTVSTAALPGDSAKHVAYPVLSGLGDSSQETFWNDLFQKEADVSRLRPSAESCREDPGHIPGNGGRNLWTDRLQY